VAEHRGTWDDRRRALVEAAYHVIATRGFEGLRTRAVAARARVNIATLHYYFPNKEALVQAVTEYLTEQFRTVHAPGGPPAATAQARLQQEFDDVTYYTAARRDLVIVMLELMLRAQRDPVTHRMLARAHRGWRAALREILTAGVREGTLRQDLDPDAAAVIVSGLITGLGLVAGNRTDYARAREEIGRWLAGPAPRTAGAGAPRTARPAMSGDTSARRRGRGGAQ